MGAQRPSLGDILLRTDKELPWPDTRLSILESQHEMKPTEPLEAHAVGMGGVRKRKKITRRNFREHYSRVSRSTYLPVEFERPARDLQHGGKNNRPGFTYRHDMLSRIRAQTLEKPQVTLTGWAALRILGLPFWVDDMPVQILAAAGGRTPRSVMEPHIVTQRRRPDLAERRTWRPEFQDLPEETTCVTGQLALAHALKAVLRHEATWWVPYTGWVGDPLGLSQTDIRAVQLLDAARRYLPGDVLGEISADFRAQDAQALGGAESAPSAGASPPHTFAAGIIDQRRLRKLLRLSTPLADSPMETLLRLLLQTVLPDLKPQVTLLDSLDPDMPVTTADLWSATTRIAVFYDGGHHDAPQQRYIDARVDRELQDQGIRVLRFTKLDLRDPVNIVNAVMRAAKVDHHM